MGTERQVAGDHQRPWLVQIAACVIKQQFWRNMVLWQPRLWRPGGQIGHNHGLCEILASLLLRYVRTSFLPGSTLKSANALAMDFFFYGTLCDPEVREHVLGYRPSPRQLRPARLAGFRRKQARGKSYPVLIRSPQSQVDGVMFTARPADIAALMAYEGPEYRTCRLPVRRVGTTALASPNRALVFLPASNSSGAALSASHGDWHFDRWRRRDKAAFLSSLQIKD